MIEAVYETVTAIFINKCDEDPFSIVLLFYAVS